MAWKKEGDTAGNDPRVLAVVEHPRADSRSVNEVWGFFSRVSSYLALHPNDTLRVPYSACLQIASHDQQQLELLWQQCVFAGLGQVVDLPDGRRAFQIVNDPQFVHVKTASEIAFEAQRKADNGDTHMTVQIRMRDGDACRYCGLVVWFADRRGGKGGTYDHRPPGRPGSAETSVVACGACNSGRGALSRGLPPDEGLAAADERYPLLQAPAQPYWSPSTREWLNRHATILRQYGLTPPELASPDEKPIKSGTPAPGAAAASAPGAARPATGGAVAAAPEQRTARPEREDVGRSRQIPADPMPAGSGDAGSGRDGTGRAGSGGSGQGRTPPTAPPPAESTDQPADRPRRARRGRRGGKRQRGTSTTSTTTSTTMDADGSTD